MPVPGYEGWAELGSVLAGDQGDPDVYQDTLKKTYSTDEQLQKARRARSLAMIDAVRSEHFQKLPGMSTELGISPAEASLMAAGGGNASQLMGARNAAGEQAFRAAAVEEAMLGDYDDANAQLFGVASGPLQINDVTGGVATNPYQAAAPIRLTPEGQSELGVDESAIAANFARANSSNASARLSNVKADAGGFSPNSAATKYTQPTQTALDNAFTTSVPDEFGNPQDVFDQDTYADFIQWRDANPQLNGPQALDQYLLQRSGVLGDGINIINPNKPGSMTVRPPARAAAPKTDAEYNALPSGALFIDPDDGQTYRKP